MDKEKNERFNELIKSLSVDSEQFVDALFELMERLAQGNPRLLKKERQIYAKFFVAAINHIVTLNTSNDTLNRLRNTNEELEESYKENRDLLKQQIALLHRLLDHFKPGWRDLGYDI